MNFYWQIITGMPNKIIAPYSSSTQILQWDPTTILNYFKHKRLLDLSSFNIKYYAFNLKI